MSNLEWRLHHRKEDIEAERLKRELKLEEENRAAKANTQEIRALELAKTNAAQQVRTNNMLHQATEAWAKNDLPPFETIVSQLQIRQKLLILGQTLQVKNLDWSPIEISLLDEDYWRTTAKTPDSFRVTFPGLKLVMTVDERRGNQNNQLKDIITVEITSRYGFNNFVHEPKRPAYESLGLNVKFDYNYWQKYKDYTAGFLYRTSYKNEQSGATFFDWYTELPIIDLRSSSDDFDSHIVKFYDYYERTTKDKNISYSYYGPPPPEPPTW